MNAEQNTFRTEWYPGLLSCLFLFCTSVTAFFLPVFFDEQLGFTGSQIGLLFALQAITGVLATLPVGIVNDRLTSRSLVAASLFFVGTAFVLMAWTKVYWIYLGVFVYWAFMYNLFRLSMDVQVLKTGNGVGVSRRLIRYHGLRFTGLGLGTAFAGYILNLFDFQLTLTVIGGVCILLTVFAFKLSPTPVSGAKLSEYKADITQPRVLLFALWIFLFATHWGAEMTCYGLFLRNNLSLSMVGMGWYMSAEFAIIVVIFMGLLVRGFTLKGNGFRWVAIIGLALSGIGHIGMIFPPVELSLFFRLMHGVGDGLMFLVLYIGIARLFNVERMGGNAGFINLAAMLGTVLGALISGPLGESHGYEVPILASGFLILLLILPILAFRNPNTPRNHSRFSISEKSL